MATKSLQKQAGFALLLTLLVVSVLVSIGVAVLSLSVSQVRLATNARDSEVAFHAANAGLECALYWRRTASSTMESGGTVSPIRCFAEPDPQNVSPTTLVDNSSGEAYFYQYEFEWGPAELVRCTEIDTVVGSSSLSGPGLQIPGMTGLIPGYTGDDPKVCEPGTKCSVIAVRGYNKPCSSVSSFGTVQREVLLQL